MKKDDHYNIITKEFVYFYMDLETGEYDDCDFSKLIKKSYYKILDHSKMIDMIKYRIKNQQQLKLNMVDICDNYTKKDLFEAFSHYAFVSISNQPYNKDELLEEFEEWFKRKYSK